MPPRSAISFHVCCAILLAACGGPRPSFEQVELEKAQELIQSERWLTVVDVQADDLRRSPLGRKSVPWTLNRDEAPMLPPLSDAPVLVVASGPRLGYRAASLIASERNLAVYLVIVESAGQRGRLYARDPVDTGQKENTHGRDS